MLHRARAPIDGCDPPQVASDATAMLAHKALRLDVEAFIIIVVLTTR